MILGVDTGGTFTDFALVSKDKDHKLVITTHKVLSTPKEPQLAILQGIKELGLEQLMQQGQLKIVHGSTVATNALLENKGVRTAFITNQGFKDILTIARQTRPQLYQLENPPQTIPVSPELCLEIDGRVNFQGLILEEITLEALQLLVQQLEHLKPDAIAITLLFSFLNSSQELRVIQYLQQHLSWSPFICCSSQVLPECNEYERGIATWLNASLGPLLENYLLNLKAKTQPSALSIMQSSGGTIDAEQAAKKSINLLLSGPAGGLAAANFLGQHLNQPRLLTFDMGGTSTDVALIEGKINLTNEGMIGGYPVAVPMVDMHTIGSGGGSIANVDEGGLLRVGPRSAGAKPGPACYNLGGLQATVTDANLVLGRLLSSEFMGGNLSLNKAAAVKSLVPLAERLKISVIDTASGIIQIANEHMARALRVISIERGNDPANYRLCCFGGAGGLHICALARSLGMKQALVPVHAGVLSALGMYLAPIERQLSASYPCALGDLKLQALNQHILNLKEEALELLALEQVKTTSITFVVSTDIRYSGQTACINVPYIQLSSLAEDFQALHKQRYGHRLTGKIELVTIRVTATSQIRQHSLPPLTHSDIHKPSSTTDIHDIAKQVPVYKRASLSPGQTISGPALITESTSTTLIEPNWNVTVDALGNLFLNS